MTAVLLDACFLIDLMANDEGAIAKLDELTGDAARLSVAAATVTEVERGLHGRERETFRDVMDSIEVVPYDYDAARRATSLLRTLDEAGTPIGAVDAMVAATALGQDGRVVTRNVSEFRRVDELRVVPY